MKINNTHYKNYMNEIMCNDSFNIEKGMYHGECYLTQISVPVVILVYYNKDFDFLRYYHYSVRWRWRIRLGSQRFSLFVSSTTVLLNLRRFKPVLLCPYWHFF